MELSVIHAWTHHTANIQTSYSDNQPISECCNRSSLTLGGTSSRTARQDLLTVTRAASGDLHTQVVCLVKESCTRSCAFVGQFIHSLWHSHFPGDDHGERDWFRCAWTDPSWFPLLVSRVSCTNKSRKTKTYPILTPKNYLWIVDFGPFLMLILAHLYSKNFFYDVILCANISRNKGDSGFKISTHPYNHHVIIQLYWIYICVFVFCLVACFS